MEPVGKATAWLFELCCCSLDRPRTSQMSVGLAIPNQCVWQIPTNLFPRFGQVQPETDKTCIRHERLFLLLLTATLTRHPRAGGV